MKVAKQQKAVFVCSACGTSSPKWVGQCPDCGEWNTLTETVSSGGRDIGYAGTQAGVQRLADVPLETGSRHGTGIDELDRVLGGGLVAGSVVLLGGDPGIGKSTLLLQTLVSLGQSLKALYVTGEESLQQVGLRARRLGLADADVHMLAETCVERIIAHAQRENPQVLVIDSIQTMYTEQMQSAPGGVGQVRESAAQLVRYAKQTGNALFLAGHVTKEGALAGPRVLEHMVDTVLYFEGDTSSQFRVIRAVKNRFGAANELGVFAMTDRGLREVSNPSAIFLSRHDTEAAGSAINVTREGSRPMLVEVQALVDESHLPSPRRVTLGLEQNRLSMLLAVLHRHGGVAMFDQDVYVNVVGGVRITETGVDLAVLLAVLSSFRASPLPAGLVVFGEVGLAGEIRPVPGGPERLRAAAKHGFKRAIVPQANVPRQPIEGLEVVAVTRLSEALDAL